MIANFKFEVYKRLFYRAKEDIYIPDYMSRIKGFHAYAETDQLNTIQKKGYLSIEFGHTDNKLLDIPVLENTPISIQDFTSVDIANKGSLIMRTIYKPLKNQENIDKYTIKIALHYE